MKPGYSCYYLWGLFALLSREKYSEYCTKFNVVYNYFVSCSEDRNKTVSEICYLRNYDDSMVTTLCNAGFIKLKDNINLDKVRSYEYNDLGLFKEGNFILEGRYIFPVRDMLGNVIALIGWYPDDKKYITSASTLFSKTCLFYGMEQLKSTGLGKNYFLVEGIFDTLVLRSLGFNAVGMMGIDTSKIKVTLYGLFKRLIGIPDSDPSGRKILLSDGWRLPLNSSYMNWDLRYNWKDIDELYKSVDLEGLKEVLSSVWSVKDRLITLEV